MGVGVLLPWNAFVTADDYFLMLYPASFHVERTFAVCYFLTNLACILLLIRHGQRIDARRRALFGFWGYVACLVAVPLLDATLHTDPQGAVPRPGFPYALTLLAVLACGAFNGVGQGSIFGLAGNLPFRYNAALNAGVAGSGLIVNAARLLTKGAMPDDESGLRASAYIYFGLATATCLLCVYVFQVAMPRLPVLAYYAARTTHNKDVVVGDGALEDETDQLIGDQDEERGGRSAVSCHPDSVAPPLPVRRGPPLDRGSWADRTCPPTPSGSRAGRGGGGRAVGPEGGEPDGPRQKTGGRGAEPRREQGARPEEHLALQRRHRADVLGDLHAVPRVAHGGRGVPRPRGLVRHPADHGVQPLRPRGPRGQQLPPRRPQNGPGLRGRADRAGESLFPSRNAKTASDTD